MLLGLGVWEFVSASFPFQRWVSFFIFVWFHCVNLNVCTLVLYYFPLPDNVRFIFCAITQTGSMILYPGYILRDTNQVIATVEATPVDDPFDPINEWDIGDKYIPTIWKLYCLFLRQMNLFSDAVACLFGLFLNFYAFGKIWNEMLND